ncbi:TRE Xcomplex subunit Tex1 [Schizosaccharomyces japonicus yFS275]|uniref:TRE Xcomplex subunit Tex1 n=1 Tax=Schizosaccharomyces japonicus (strain yFS275 / FY16936) TaxID=402676 RepID=B6K6F5_SCHJY|nr:TRE Xcomplex subunit Tex1 [Schizosaccharomyces japonicus yFS275]EEB09109.1 TRE Xcomplex subunit Tex1 [Schizosaccharomyces japonicus yFS275]
MARNTSLANIDFSSYRSHDVGYNKTSVRSIGWNATGSRLASSYSDKSVRIWNSERLEYKYSTELGGHGYGTVDQLVWDPTQTDRLLTVYSDRFIRFWDYRSPRPIAELPSKYDNIYATWSPSGKYCAVGSKDDMITFIDTREFQVMETIQQPCETNECCWSFSEDLFYMTTGLGTVQIMEWPSFKKIHELKGHTANCFAIGLSPNGHNLAVGGADAITSIWDTKEWCCVRNITDYSTAVRTLDFSFDSEYIATGSEDGSILINEVNSAKQLRKLSTAGPITKVSWHPSKQILAYTKMQMGNSGLCLLSP